MALSPYGESGFEKQGFDNPGSPKAQSHGCNCPRTQNNDGFGLPAGTGGSDPAGGPAFYISGSCPVHARHRTAVTLPGMRDKPS